MSWELILNMEDFSNSKNQLNVHDKNLCQIKLVPGLLTNFLNNRRGSRLNCLSCLTLYKELTSTLYNMVRKLIDFKNSNIAIRVYKLTPWCYDLVCSMLNLRLYQKRLLLFSDLILEEFVLLIFQIFS